MSLSDFNYLFPSMVALLVAIAICEYVNKAKSNKRRSEMAYTSMPQTVYPHPNAYYDEILKDKKHEMLLACLKGGMSYEDAKSACAQEFDARIEEARNRRIENLKTIQEFHEKHSDEIIEQIRGKNEDYVEKPRWNPWR